MCLNTRGGKGLLYTFLTLFLAAGVHGAAVSDSLSLVLRNPQNVAAVAVKSATSHNFTVFIAFDDIPDSLGSLIHDPDLSEWSYVSPESSLSTPKVANHYKYNGPVDATVAFRALSNGVIGVDSLIDLQYEVKGLEQWRNIINIGLSDHAPGDTIPLIFVNQITKESVYLGIDLTFSEGVVDSNGIFFIGCEDFEGYHIWRGIVDGNGNIYDIEAIGEVSKEEAFDGAYCDALYLNNIIPALRQTGVYSFQQGGTCFESGRETRIVIPDSPIFPDSTLGQNQLLWMDYDAFDGYTYAYAVSSFDRGYNIDSGRQGLKKIDSFIHCEADTIESTVPCPSLFTKLSIEVAPQDELINVYAVPNPYRTGTSVYTTPNYHNFPDNKIRFVNVPAECKLAIYTTAGDLVWETEHHNNETGIISWDTKNRGGQEVTSGIYLYKVEDNKGSNMYGRLIIIR